MKLEWLDIRDFRNHKNSRLMCAPGATILVGDNGEGKTNLAEAVSYICLTKSFYADSDGLVVRRGAAAFFLEAELNGDNNVRFRVRLQYDGDAGEKSVTVNGAPVERLSDQIGRFPIVVMSPEQAGITAGLPAERRRFMDLVISQASRLYLEDLMSYRRVLRQRNKILLDGKLSRRDCSRELPPWDESLAELGARLVGKRREFLEEFRPGLVDAYEQLAGAREQPSVQYEPNVAPAGDAGELKARMMDALREKQQDELRLGSTLVGPHRDELKMEVAGLEARKFASQGQHKTLLIALKLAELKFLKERSDETPILVLDDVFSELDRTRAGRLLDLLPGFGQTFITTTTDAAFPSGFYERPENTRVVIKAGAIAREKESTIIH